MRTPNDCTNRGRQTFPRVLVWVAFVVGALVLTGCGSGSENSASANGDTGTTSTGQLESEAEDRLADAQDQLQDLQDSGALGSGSGVITIENVDYLFEATVCFISDESFEASGPGQTADGVPYWASLSTGVTTRESMEESGLPQANIDAFFGDRDSMQSFGLEVELGKEDAFSSGDGSMADFRIQVLDIGTVDTVSHTIDGKTMTGTGSVSDYNGVAIAYSETAPASFSANCN